MVRSEHFHRDLDAGYGREASTFNSLTARGGGNGGGVGSVAQTGQSWMGNGGGGAGVEDTTMLTMEEQHLSANTSTAAIMVDMMVVLVQVLLNIIQVVVLVLSKWCGW